VQVHYPSIAQEQLDIADKVDVSAVVREVAETVIRQSIDIPRISIEPKGEVYGTYSRFDLDCTALNQEALEREIVVHNLHTKKQRTLKRETGYRATRLEDHLINELIDYDDVDYDRNADVLYDLAGQAVAHFKDRLGDNEKVRDVLREFRRVIAHVIYSQMQAHYNEGEVEYEARISKGWMALRETAYNAEAGLEAVPFRNPVEPKSLIRRMVFTGFKKCLYPKQTFDSDTERRLAMLFEDSNDVEKWFKPGRKQFPITYRFQGSDHPNYEPDFVAELKDKKLILETKWEKGADDEKVFAKRDAAVEWCKNATKHELQNGGKAWQYLLIPHTEVLTNATITGLIGKFGC